MTQLPHVSFRVQEFAHENSRVVIVSELTESRDNSVCAVCHRHIALNASGLVRIHGQKLNRCPGSWQAPIFISSFQDLSTIPPTTDASLNHANLARSHVKTIKRIPRAARINAAKKLASIIEDVVALNDETSWNRLFPLHHAAFGPRLGVVDAGMSLEQSTTRSERKLIAYLPYPNGTNRTKSRKLIPNFLWTL